MALRLKKSVKSGVLTAALCIFEHYSLNYDSRFLGIAIFNGRVRRTPLFLIGLFGSNGVSNPADQVHFQRETER